MPQKEGSESTAFLRLDALPPWRLAKHLPPTKGAENNLTISIVFGVGMFVNPPKIIFRAEEEVCPCA